MPIPRSVLWIASVVAKLTDRGPLRTGRAPWRKDALVVLALAAGTALYAVFFVRWAPHPFEDAAILMRYSLHLSQGHGIVWNVGEPPVDGATDFLFMVLVGFLGWLGLSIEGAVRLVGIASHFAAVLVVYAAVRRWQRGRWWMAAVSAAYLAVGPGLRYASAYFGTPMFALFALLTWLMAWRLATEGWSRGRALAFAFLALVTGLIRPEGVFLGVFMLLAVLWLGGLRAHAKTIGCFVAVFAVLGGAYFFWRWSYFGHPLPNPYYKKGGGTLHLGGLISSVHGALRFTLPFSLAFIAGLRSRRTARLVVFALIPIGGFVGIWVLLSDAMNYLWRFQYAVVPLVVTSWVPLVEGIFEEWRLPRWWEIARRPKRLLVVLGAVVFLWLLVYHHRMSRLPIRFGDGNYAVATMLRDYADKGYVMAATEAGLLPYYSRWRAVDPWGLNDPWIARHGRVTEEYLDRFKPHLVMFHAYFSPLVEPVVRTEWDAMAMTLRDYARKRGYVFAACFGETPFDTHHYYVRPDFADSAEIVRRIRSVRYTWMSTGRVCVNFALPAGKLQITSSKSQTSTKSQ